MIKVAMLSKWHVHAVDYAREAMQHPDIEISVIWDEDSARGESWAAELGVPFEPKLENVLKNPDIDGVIVDTPTSMHKEVILAAAQHNKHIYSEKVLAFTVADCEEIFQAVEQNVVQLMLSLPRLTEDYYLYAQKALDEGLIGTLTSIRCRCAHNGAVADWLPEYFYDKKLCGGGALIDLGAHPIYLSNRLAGPAKAVTARLHTFLDHLQVDDNAAVIVEYESGALGILETSFVSNGSPFQLELYGTDGTIMIEDTSVKIRSTKLSNENWATPSDIPAPIPTPMEQWADAIQNGAKPTITTDDMLKLTQINEAAKQSHEENRRVVIK
ncbi:gfo/Idh/MocA family oxidoreductase [Bacillus sp. HMF5848]|nr:gfo/Idh/MocA family oxidoreductase [Bacillus sp. HMF5848]